MKLLKDYICPLCRRTLVPTAREGLVYLECKSIYHSCPYKEELPLMSCKEYNDAFQKMRGHFTYAVPEPEI